MGKGTLGMQHPHHTTMEGEQLSVEEIIKAQRARVDELLATIAAETADSDTTSNAAPNNSNEEVCVSAATAHADTVGQGMRRTEVAVLDQITEFKVKAATEESERRTREEEAVQHRVAARGRVDADSHARQEALRLRFEALYRHTVPHALHAAIAEQRQLCEEVLAMKDKLASELQSQLDEKESEYVMQLRQNAVDVDDLVQAMHTTTDEYLDQYTSQLDAVEKAYDKERREMIDQYAAEINQLVRTRRSKETDYRKRRENKIIEAQAALESKYEETYEECNTVKAAREDEINALHRELEKCKTDFMLNDERISYNLQVLRERVKENKAIQNQYKRKLATLQGNLSSLITRHNNMSKRYQRCNRDLTAQLHRVGAQYNDLQHKFQLFEKYDKEKYRQVWQLHDKKCKHLVHRCLQADRVIFEDILNMPWAPPEMVFWPESKEDDNTLDNTVDDDDIPDEVELSEPELTMLQILRSQAPFLVDENIRAAIQQVKGATAEQADMEGLLTTLNIQKSDDVRDMLEYFMVDDDRGTHALINPQEFIRALNAFLEQRNAKQAREKDASMQQKEHSKKTTRKEEDEQHRTEERVYWTRLAQSVPQEHIHVWGALEKGLEEYLAQLQQRRSLIATTDAMRARNEELKGLLSQYVQSNINYQLCSAPRLMQTQ